MNTSPLVSIIIPTKNSSRTIEQCLVSICNQTYKNIEIIVVDNFSDDGTFEISKKYTDQVFLKGPERTTQKNFGIENSKGEYLCFIDSDMELEVGVIDECIKLFKSEESIGGICIPERTIGKSFFVKVRNFERSFYEDTAIESARFFYKTDVTLVGGFEEDLIFFEESLLPQKIESKTGKSTKYRVKNYINHDEDSINLNYWFKKKYYYGKSLDLYRKKVIEIGIQQTAKGQIGIIKRYLLFLQNSRFYKKPFLAMCVLILKTCEFGAGGIGLLISKIKVYV